MKKIISICLCLVVFTLPVTIVFADVFNYELQEDIQYKLCKKNEQQLEINNNNYQSGFYPTEKGLKNWECKELMKKMIKYGKQRKKTYKRNVITTNLIAMTVWSYIFIEAVPFLIYVNLVGLYNISKVVFFYDREEIERKLGEVSKKAIEYGCFEYEEK